LGWARAQNKILDEIIDKHCLLLYINYCAEREKRTRRGVPIPNTRVGAVSASSDRSLFDANFVQSQLKKMFFGALRIRKEQDAQDPELAQKRPATTVIVYDAIKTRMDEALERVRK
jgi:hypothetical protein